MASTKMTVTQFTFLTALNMLGSGIIMLPAKLASVGMISLLAWFVTLFGVVALAYSFAKCGMYTRHPGGLGGIAQATFGRSGSFLVNYIYAISLVIANVAILATAVSYLLSTLHITLPTIAVTAIMVFLLWLATAANFRGARFTSIISALFLWGIFIPLLILAVAGPFWFSLDTFSANWNPNGYSLFDAIGHTVSMQLWAFLGLESACANSDSVDNPELNVPRAVLTATFVVGAIYILITTLVGGIVPNADLIDSAAPFAVIFDKLFGHTASVILAICMSLTCCGSLISWQFTVSRVVKTSANLGYFPKFFALTNAKDVPIIGLVIIGIVQTVLVIVSTTPSLFTQFTVLVDISVVTNVIPYMLCVAALFSLVRTAGSLEKNPKLVFFFATVALLYTFFVFSSYSSLMVRLSTLILFIGCALYGMFMPRERL